MSATAMGFRFATWVSEVPTGGNVYDASLATALRAFGAAPRPYRGNQPLAGRLGRGPAGGLTGSSPGSLRKSGRRSSQSDLAARIRIRGARTGADLESEWSATDLLVLCSRAETYGMVVTEALSRGIPSVVSAETGAVQAQAAGRLASGAGGSSHAGSQVPAGDPDALAGALRRWLTDAGHPADWSAAAARQRDALPTWSETAAAVLRVIDPTPIDRPCPGALPGVLVGVPSPVGMEWDSSGRRLLGGVCSCADRVGVGRAPSHRY